MRSIHWVGGEKGGVGKSLMARLLAQYCIDHELPFVGFDTDKSHGALMRFYADYASPVVIDRYESLDRIVEAAGTEPEQRVIVDLAAQTQAALEQWMEESGLLDIAPELDLRIRYWHVMDSGRDSVDLLRALLDRFGGRLDIVLVLNQLRGDDFGILEQSGQKQRALELGARFMPLKRLHEAAMIKIDAASSSFWAATQGGGAHEMGILERQRVKTWLKNAYQDLSDLGV
ncbi:MAG: mobilization protein [Thiomonas sp.]|uniref:mobilization protein n=1 Tax=Thiomonas sp. TaxID=2047785 RepID=UPI002A359AD9|nr:mobilization protein [Thiomonas sp.]MDY0331500.1 mobilization protein [Thiomonas sp.]